MEGSFKLVEKAVREELIRIETLHFVRRFKEEEGVKFNVSEETVLLRSP